MKAIKRNSVLLVAGLAMCGGLMSCTKWLDDAKPKDQNLEEKQYATEAGINAVMNGLYRNMAGENLYGGTLTLTTTELLAHYYYYEEEERNNADMTTFRNMSSYNYADDGVKGTFSSLWRDMYNAIFRVNNFLANLKKSSAIAGTRKNILLGEAYGLRAFLHFDLFRLFGDYRNATQTLPYNTSDKVVPTAPISNEEYFAHIRSDIDSAKLLLANDPIITEGVKDLTNVDLNNTNLQADEIFRTYLRSYRFNYYAARALEARVLMWQGQYTAAAEAADEVLKCEKFAWTPKGDVTNNHDYLFFSEVIFGINNPDLFTRWESYTYGNQLGKTYTVGADNLRENIFGNDNPGTEMILWEDVRIRQWTTSRINEQYISIKYAEFSSKYKNDPRQKFQPLIRLSEMRLIMAESLLAMGATKNAVQELNTLRMQRGSQVESLPAETILPAEINSILETEYYKEFYGEGQSFFFLKRRNAKSIFKAFGEGTVDFDTTKYVVPIPEAEFDAF